MIYCRVQSGVVVDRALFEEPMPSDWPDFAAWHENSEAQIGWSFSGGVFLPPEPEPPNEMPVAQTASLYAVAALSIQPGDIGGIDTSVNFAAALYMDVGSYLLFFSEAQENTNYLAKAYDDETRVRVTEKGLDYIVVTVTDSDGNPADPAEISVEVIRVA